MAGGDPTHHGGDLFQTEFFSEDAAYDAFAENYAFDDTVLNWVREITSKRLTDDAQKLVLSRKLSKAVRQLACDEDALAAANETLEEIGITLTE